MLQYFHKQLIQLWKLSLIRNWSPRINANGGDHLSSLPRHCAQFYPQQLLAKRNFSMMQCTYGWNFM